MNSSDQQRVRRNELPVPLRSFDSLQELLQRELDDLEKLKASAIPPLPNDLDALRVELTYHSNAIEGNTLTLADTHLVVVEGLAPASHGKSLREIYEARYHHRALERLEEWLETGTQDPFTERGLLELHEEILKEIQPLSAGRFRNQRVRISGSDHVPPNSIHFDQLLPPMLSISNDETVQPALRAAEIHYNIAAVHPFDDGNGRTARLMMNAVLLSHDYPFCIIPVESRTEYVATLEQAHTEGNIEPLTRLILGCIASSFR